MYLTIIHISINYSKFFERKNSHFVLHTITRLAWYLILYIRNVTALVFNSSLNFLSFFFHTSTYHTHLTSTTMILQLTFNRLWWFLSCNSKHEEKECAKNDKFRRRDRHRCPHYNSKVRKICAFENSSFLLFCFLKSENLYTYTSNRMRHRKIYFLK